jgi:hypothetical protein
LAEESEDGKTEVEEVNEGNQYATVDIGWCKLMMRADMSM